MQLYRAAFVRVASEKEGVTDSILMGKLRQPLKSLDIWDLSQE